jgi:hypothetical protein
MCLSEYQNAKRCGGRRTGDTEGEQLANVHQHITQTRDEKLGFL